MKEEQDYKLFVYGPDEPARQEGETPRTEDHFASIVDVGRRASGSTPDFCRTLERELSAKQAEVDMWKEIAEENQRESISKTEKINLQNRELESLKAAQGWRPISEAPKDGTAIMVKLPDSDMPAIVRWDSALQMAHDPTWVICWDGEHVGKTSKPTHWMPLPDPPLESEPKCSECEEEISADGDGHNSRCSRLHMPPEGLEIPTPPVDSNQPKS